MAEKHLKQEPLAHLDPEAKLKFGYTKDNPGIIICQDEDNLLFTLRGNPNDRNFVSFIKKITGSELPKALFSVSNKQNNLQILWMGPDEFLIVSSQKHNRLSLEKFQKALEGKNCAIIDVSDTKCVLQISGEFAQETLMKGCSVDLHTSNFVPGSVVNTVLDQTPITIVRLKSVNSEDSFKIFVPRSYAYHLWLWLEVATKEHFTWQ